MGRPVPTRNEEILLYQTLLGAWPLESTDSEKFPQRIQDYMIKAIREAMVHTKWTVPNVPHEAAVTSFIAAILRQSEENEFLRDFLDFVPRIAFFGALNGLSQALIKITFPGIPDFYQGSELWDLRLVDPDNRGLVDFAQRVAMLQDLKTRKPRADELLNHWQDGGLKLHVMAQALCFRRSQSELFTKGEHIPVRATGKWKDHIFAFARCLGNRWALVVTPRLSSALTQPGDFPLGEIWENTFLNLPTTAPAKWRNVFEPETEYSNSGKSHSLKLSRILQSFPLTLLAAGENRG
jgi:(1->4)-alpha-D-glucan 1-alpha-D-glucosylmutase